MQLSIHFIAGFNILTENDISAEPTPMDVTLGFDQYHLYSSMHDQRLHRNIAYIYFSSCMLIRARIVYHEKAVRDILFIIGGARVYIFYLASPYRTVFPPFPIVGLEYLSASSSTHILRCSKVLHDGRG